MDAPRAQSKYPALRHRVHRIEDQIREGIADLPFGAHDFHRLGREFRPQFDHCASLECQVAPACLGQLDHLLESAIEFDARQFELRLAGSIELSHARDGRCHIVYGPLDSREMPPRPLAQIRLALQQRIGIQGDR